MSILVIGATGGVGRLVVDELVRIAAPVRALVRNPADAGVDASVQVVQGDLTVPESLDDALRGVDAVFLLWTAGLDTVSEVIRRIAAHAQRIVFLSSPHQTPHPFFQQSPDNPMAVLQRSIEREIAHNGMNATILRPGMFASNALNWWAPAIRNGDTVRWVYGAAETAPVDERDIAAVAVRALTGDAKSGDFVLTGPQSLTQIEQVRIIGEVIGRKITFDDLSEEEFRRDVAAAWPAPIVDMLLAAWRGALGQPAYVTASISNTLGRPPKTFREWAEDHADSFGRR